LGGTKGTRNGKNGEKGIVSLSTTLLVFPTLILIQCYAENLPKKLILLSL